jgi:hypothetical protein
LEKGKKQKFFFKSVFVPGQAGRKELPQKTFKLPLHCVPQLLKLLLTSPWAEKATIDIEQFRLLLSIACFQQSPRSYPMLAP